MVREHMLRTAHGTLRAAFRALTSTVSSAHPRRYPPRFYSTASTMGAIATQTVNTSDRLRSLRQLMAEAAVDAYIVPSEDQRKSSCPTGSRIYVSESADYVCVDSSEYPAQCDERRSFISGFNGSAGESCELSTDRA